MKEILKRLTSNPLTTLELLLVSLLISILALAVPIFVIQVLKRYVAYGNDATLATLIGGALLAIVFEFAFRLLRNRMISSAGGGSWGISREGKAPARFAIG